MAEAASIVATARERLSELEPFCHFHLNSGVDGLILYLDDPGQA